VYEENLVCINASETGCGRSCTFKVSVKGIHPKICPHNQTSSLPWRYPQDI